MKRILTAIAFAVLLSGFEASAQEALYIRVRNTKLRQSPKHFSPAIADLKLGDRVTGREDDNGWYRVNYGSKSGYLHEATLSDKKIVTDPAKAYAADSSDVVLAGKGFNKEVEKQYASQNPSLNFAAVNMMERISVKDSEVISFVKSGGLNG